MPLFDTVRSSATAKAKDAVTRVKSYAASHKDQLGKGIAKAEQTADERTAGKYHAQISKASDQAQAYVDGLPAAEPPAPARDGPTHP